MGCGGNGSPQDAGAPGAIAVDATVTLVQPPYVCPGISGFSISPAELAGGQAAELGVSTAGPSPTLVHWSSIPESNGEFSDPSLEAPTFRCTDAGTVEVTVQVGLADPNVGNLCEGVAGTRYSGSIHCE